MTRLTRRFDRFINRRSVDPVGGFESIGGARLTSTVEESPGPVGKARRTVSVVIPTRGRPDQVVRAVHSALAQTLPPLEVIVVIDGEDLPTRARLERLGFPSLRILETKTPVGAGEARNVGIQAAQGSWIALLDDDDEWLPVKLERQLALGAIAPVRYPIVTSRIIARSNRDFLWPVRFLAPGEDLSEYLFIRHSLFQGEGLAQTSTLMAPRELLLQVPFTTGLPQHQDWDWLLRATTVEGAALLFVAEPLAVWHIDQPGGSLSQRPGWAQSVAWIQGMRHRVTPRAYAAFLLTVVAAKARQERQWTAFASLAREAMVAGEPRIKDWLLFLGMWLVPRGLRRWVRGSMLGRRPPPSSLHPPGAEASADTVEEGDRGRGRHAGSSAWTKDPGGATKLVSIVIPCYNTGRYLGAAIESALGQTHPRVEVIVVDDGSTDNSRAVAESFGDRITLVCQSNQGLSAARNAAIAAARGEYLLLLDADDILGPTCAASRARVLDDDPGIGLVAGYYREIDAAGQVLPRMPQRRRVGRLSAFRQAVRRNWGPPVGWAFRREAFQRCEGFDTSLRSCEDWDLAIRVALHYRIGYVPTVEAYYRRLDGAMSRNHAVMLLEMTKVQRKNRAYAQNGWHYWLDCRFGEFELGRRILYESLFQGQRLPAIGKTFHLLRRKPSLLWIGLLAAGTFLAGKRPSSRVDPTDEVALASPQSRALGS